MFSKISKIPPALWATGGLEPSRNQSTNQVIKYSGNLVLEEWFTPPPTSSPGSKIVRSRAVVVAYFRLFRDLGRHRFFIIFPTPFLIDFGSILAPKMAPKSTPNRQKIDPKTRSKNYRLLGPIFHRFLLDVAPNLS